MHNLNCIKNADYDTPLISRVRALSAKAKDIKRLHKKPRNNSWLFINFKAN